MDTHTPSSEPIDSVVEARQIREPEEVSVPLSSSITSVLRAVVCVAVLVFMQAVVAGLVVEWRELGEFSGARFLLQLQLACASSLVYALTKWHKRRSSWLVVCIILTCSVLGAGFLSDANTYHTLAFPALVPAPPQLPESGVFVVLPANVILVVFEAFVCFKMVAFPLFMLYEVVWKWRHWRYLAVMRMAYPAGYGFGF